MTEALLASAVLLGLVYSATPGAVNAESLRRGTRRGFRAALLVQLGSLSGDMVWAAIALTGTAFLVQNRPVALLLGIIGSCFLLRQGYAALVAATRPGAEPGAGNQAGGDFVSGTFFSLTNPFAVAFWLSLGAGVTATAHSGPPAAATFFAGFFLGALFWCASFAALVSLGRRYANSRVLRAIDAVAGAALSYFGVRLLLRSLSALRLLRLVTG